MCIRDRFGINFNVYFLLLTRRRQKEALKSQAMRWYLIIIAAAIGLITLNVRGLFSSWWEAFHHTAFQVASIITTTGFSTSDFNLWPGFSRTILVLLMFVGACAGSTGGGIKMCIRDSLRSAQTIRKYPRFLAEPGAFFRLILPPRPG